MPLTFVHALWGDELVPGWPKVLWDTQWTADQRRTYPGRLLVFAYGRQNYRYLYAEGWDPILITEESVLPIPAPRIVDGDRFGERPHGVSMWTMKLHAIITAFDLGATEVIWLDWDTRMQTGVTESDYDAIRSGPPFQGRMRLNKGRTWPVRRVAYGGGCYYVRDRELVQQVMAKCSQPNDRGSDESWITWFAEQRYGTRARRFDSKTHRDIGLDSPRLYSTYRNAFEQPEDVVSLHWDVMWRNHYQPPRHWRDGVRYVTLADLYDTKPSILRRFWMRRKA